MKTLSFNITQRSIDRLEKMKKAINTDSDAEVIRNALRLYGWIVDTYKNGERIVLVTKEEDIVEITMFHPDQHPGNPNTGRKLPDNVVELFPRID